MWDWRHRAANEYAHGPSPASGGAGSGTTARFWSPYLSPCVMQPWPDLLLTRAGASSATSFCSPAPGSWGDWRLLWGLRASLAAGGARVTPWGFELSTITFRREKAFVKREFRSLGEKNAWPAGAVASLAVGRGRRCMGSIFRAPSSLAGLPNAAAGLSAGRAGSSILLRANSHIVKCRIQTFGSMTFFFFFEKQTFDLGIISCLQKYYKERTEFPLF